MKLRDYQQHAATAALDWVRKCLDPCLIEAPTGAGKSHIIAAIAHEIKKMSGKKVLVLAPSAELVDQDYQKYLHTGEPASIYSASLGKKTMHHDVVFGSPLTVANSLQRFGNQFAAVVIDEAHGLTNTLFKILNHLKQQNPKLRIIGLTATSFRTFTGYIYANHYEHGKVDESQTVDPFFHTLVYSIDPWYLISQGYLSPPVFEETNEHYDTSGLTLNRTGNWDAKTVDQAFVGKGRKTAAIVADVVEKSKYRQGVMIFAATIRHAKEICESLPPELTRLVTGENAKGEREKIINDFKAKRFKYLVNVAVLTTGFDSDHVDVVAILRKTESPGLLQQIIGRGLRISEHKKDCLILDYAENLDYHFPHGDIFAPEIKAKKKGISEPIEAKCELCGHNNQFSMRPNPEGYPIDKNGYFIDLAGNRIKAANGMDLPAHFGRRCTGEALIAGIHSRCSYKWSVKTCPECEHDNDIAARHCGKCGEELVDPNEKLKEIAAKIENDPYRVREANVTGWSLRRWPGRDDKPDTLRVDYYIDDKPNELSQWFSPMSDSQWIRGKWERFSVDSFGRVMNDIDSVLDEDGVMPSRVVFKKKKGTRFMEVLGVGYE